MMNKLNYEAPSIRELHTDFEGVICASGGYSGTGNVNVTASQSSRYGDGGVQNW
ncbi:MAG: hypothetical protein K5910_01155 [Bacteroidales bacterium]|nr:hypothetical protein [Bacteroidales bacterium]